MPEILVYALSTCPWCRKTKKFFADRNIPIDCTDFDLADDERQEQIMNDMLDHGGTGQFPYVRIGEETVVGWNPEKYAELLRLDE